MKKNFAEIFDESTSELEYIDPVPNSVRVLVRDDLQRAITVSNRDLIERYGLSKNALKSDSEIEKLAYNTEKSMYKYNGEVLKDYVETQLTFLVFLLDKYLSSDFVLFRFLINIDIDDIYLEPDCPELLFSDMLYSAGDPLDKHHVRKEIIEEISKRLPHILYDYINEQNSTNIASLKYSIPKELNEEMERYRDSQLDRIIERLGISYADSISSSSSESDSDSDSSDGSYAIYHVKELFNKNKSSSEEDEEISDDSEKFYLDDYSDSEISEYETKENDDAKFLTDQDEIDIFEDEDIEDDPDNEGGDSDDSKVDIDISGSSDEDDEDDEGEGEDDEGEYDEDDEDDEGEDDEGEDDEGEDDEGDEGDEGGLTRFLDKVGADKKCEMCDDYFTHSYRTIEFTGEKPIIRYFCGPKCMEEWSPPKIN
jgi:hypothetical protein